MGKRVIYQVSKLPQWIDIAKIMQEKYDWKPILWIHPRNMIDTVSGNLDNVTTIVFEDINRCIFPKEHADFLRYPLDKKTLNKYSECERVALLIMERMDLGGAFLYAERYRAYIFLLMYWLNFVENYKPDIYCLTVTPHFVSDIVLYYIAKEKGIDVLFFSITAIKDYVLLSTGIGELDSDLQTNYKNVMQKYPNFRLDNLSNDMQEYVRNKRGNYADAEPWYMVRQKKRNKSSFITNVRLAKSVFYIILGIFFKGFYTDFVYMKAKNISLENKRISRVSKVKYMLKAVKYKRALQKEYQKNITHVDLSEKYVYVPLHYQPERTSCPEGSVYANQYILINLLSNNLPKGWKLYVKEHTTQFHAKHQGEKGRLLSFYKDLSKIDDVYLLSTSYNSFELTDNAQAVATITGTAGWEALLRGKPTLVFGVAWYRDCEGAFVINNNDDCKKAFKKISCKNFKINDSKILAFVEAVVRTGKKVYMSPLQAQHSQITEQELIENHVKLIEKPYRAV